MSTHGGFPWVPSCVCTTVLCSCGGAMMDDMSLGTTYRLRKHADYQLVYKRGRKQFTKNIAYFYAVRPEERRSDTAEARVGLTVPKALGKAVDRNRIKRRMRVVVRRNLGLLTGPVDVVLHPRRVVIEMEF